MVRDQYPRLAELAGDPGLAREVEAIAPRVLELSELLVDRLGVEDVGAVFPHRVTYHPTCHGLRLLRIGDRPYRLLRAVRGLELVELPEATECCGFGGTFAVKNADTSAAMLGDKIARIKDTGAEVCVAADNSCLMHIGGGLRRAARRRADGPPRRDPREHGMSATEGFPAAARTALADSQLRRNLGKATHDDPRQARRRRRARSTTGRRCATAGAAIKDRALATLPEQLERLEAAVTAAGGQVHWARDAAEANANVVEIARGHEAERGRQGQVDRHRRDRAQRGAGGGGDRRRSRPTWPS